MDGPRLLLRTTTLIEDARWYVAGAAAALAVSPGAEAQVVSFAFDPPVVVRDDAAGFPLDFDGDDDPEILFRELPGEVQSYSNSDWAGADEMTGLVGYAAYFPPSCFYFGSAFSSLPAGTRVSAGVVTTLYQGCSAAQIFSRYGTTSYGGNWLTSGPAYIGVRFRLDGRPHYGWVHLDVPNEGGQITLYRYAFNASPGAPITTGDTGTAVPVYTLDGSVNQVAFPAEGGTLRFTATVANTTGRAAELDLWLVARQGGEAVAVRRLGSGALPAGATVTRTVSTEVPASAPAGLYEVRYHVGRYPAVVDTEAFTITKAAGLGGTEGEAFMAEPAAGDLSVEGVPATAAPAYGLGAPRPNPSNGRAEFTLSVAEPQAVRVEVLDALGRRVAVLHDGTLASGAAHRLVFDGSSLPAGVYAVRAVGEAFTDVRTLTLTR